MISPNELKNGLVIKIDDELYSVIQFQHIKPGKGGAFVRTKLKNLRLGTVIDKTFRETDQIEDVFIEEKKFQYLYKADAEYFFMDSETFDQFSLNKEILGGNIKYLKENSKVTAHFCDGKIINVILPQFVKLKVTHAEHGIRGDTAKGGSKSVTLETDIKISAPLFIKNGDVIKIDTRTGKYIERA